jgi:hypothetical protein
VAFGFYKQIDSNSTHVGSNLTDFPAAIIITGDSDIRTTSNGGEVTSSSGYDIAFFSDSGLSTQLDHQLIAYDGGAAAGDLKAWVKFDPQSTGDTPIYMAYGDSGITTDQSDVTTTGTFSSYADGSHGFWLHMSQDPDASDPDDNMVDYTGEGNTFYPVNSSPNAGYNTSTTALVDSSLQGVARASGEGYIHELTKEAGAGPPDWTFSSTGHIRFDNVDFTCTIWRKEDSYGSALADRPIGGVWSGNGRGVSKFRDNYVTDETELMYHNDSGTEFLLGFGNDLSTETAWQMFTATWDTSATTLSIYLDGTFVTSATSFTLTTDPQHIMIGEDSSFFSGDGKLLDEYRFTTELKTADWLKAEYENQFDATIGTGLFWKAIGSETAAVTSGTSTIAGVGTLSVASRVVVGEDMGNYSLANLSTGIILATSVNDAVSQSFTTPSNRLSLKHVGVYVSKAGTPTSPLTCDIYATTGASGSKIPTGSSLGTAKNSFDGSSVETGVANTVCWFHFNGLILDTSTEYAFSISGGGPLFNHFILAVDASSPAASGNLASLVGSTWTADGTQDLIYGIVGYEAALMAGVGTLSASATAITGFLTLTMVEETAMQEIYMVTQEDAVSTAAIWNTALTAIGAKLVTGTSDTSKQGVLLSSVWADFRQQFLSEHIWAGAKTTQTLATFKDSDGTTAVDPEGTRWTYAFALPGSSDTRPYLHALYINGFPNSPQSSAGANNWEIEIVENDVGTMQRCLLTNSSTVDLEYVFDTKDDNIDLLSPLTRHAMGLALAWYIAPNFGKPAAERLALKAAYDEAILQAKGNNGQEGTPPLFQNTPLLDAREGGYH